MPDAAPIPDELPRGVRGITEYQVDSLLRRPRADDFADLFHCVPQIERNCFNDDLSRLDLGEIEYVVDINPFREGKYMAGTGQEIVSPAFLKRYKPDLAIAMNPIYQPEIKADLEKMGLSTEVVSV